MTPKKCEREAERPNPLLDELAKILENSSPPTDHGWATDLYVGLTFRQRLSLANALKCRDEAGALGVIGTFRKKQERAERVRRLAEVDHAACLMDSVLGRVRVAVAEARTAIPEFRRVLGHPVTGQCSSENAEILLGLVREEISDPTDQEVSLRDMLLDAFTVTQDDRAMVSDARYRGDPAARRVALRQEIKRRKHRPKSVTAPVTPKRSR
jgi:hypothetical protein